MKSVLILLYFLLLVENGSSNNVNESISEKPSIYNLSYSTNDQPEYVYHHFFAEDAPVKLGQVKHHVFLYDLVDPFQLEYKAFCSGSIISENRVLTSANCLLTNRKRQKHNLQEVKVIAGTVSTKVRLKVPHKINQVRDISKLYSQYSYRFPSYNLAILVLNENWKFNEFVNRIIIATINQEFDGVCMIPNAKATQSWFDNKYLITNQVVFISTRKCEDTYLSSRNLDYCCWYEYTKFIAKESEGSGLICHGTNDTAETEREGLLVGVSSLIRVELPSLFHRVGLFHKWITDRATVFKVDNQLLLKRDIKNVKVFAGALSTFIKMELIEKTRQHRSIRHMYSQYLYRYPSRNLLILVLNKRWIYNIFVNRILMASLDQDFDGTCHVASAKITKTGKEQKDLVLNEVRVIPRVACEEGFLLFTRLFFCTTFNQHKFTVTAESEGAGMICHGTGDPAETESEGLLVGVSSIPTVHISTLHHRVGMFQKWIKDSGNVKTGCRILILLLFCKHFIIIDFI